MMIHAKYSALVLPYLAAQSAAFLTHSSVRHHLPISPARSSTDHHHNTIFPNTALRVVADFPLEKEEKKGSSDSNENWIETADGGFLPRYDLLRNPPTKPQTGLTQVKDIHQYKAEIADEGDRMVCVRFYAPWCRACKAVEGRFRRLAKEFPGVKFVEVPVTNENTYLHKGLGVPSLPYAHIYHPTAGLVEERRINKRMFGRFKQTVGAYVEGECPVSYAEDGSTNELGAANSLTM